MRIPSPSILFSLMSALLLAPVLTVVEAEPHFKAVDVDKIFAVEGIQEKISTETPEQNEKETLKTGPHNSKKILKKNKSEMETALKSIAVPVREFCEELYWDARLEAFEAAIESLRKSPELLCDDCKSFYKILGSACHVSPSKLEKEREKVAQLSNTSSGEKDLPLPSPSSSPSASPEEGSTPATSSSPNPASSPKTRVPRRDPSPTAIDLAVRAFSPLTEISGADELSLRSLEILAQELGGEKRKASEKEYFDTLFTYVFACFDEVYEVRKAKDKKAFLESLPSDPFLKREKTLERLGVESENVEVDEELYDF